MKNNFYITIIGASMAGCASALMYAEKGIRVLLIDKGSSIESYKKHCTHFVQPCGISVLKRLGVYKDLNQFGFKSKARFWTGAGWLESKKHDYTNDEYAINLERSKFDPYIKKVVDKHPLIELRLNANVVSVSENDNQHTVNYQIGDQMFQQTSKLVVAADGRYSSVSKITNNESIIYPNDRFVYFAYYKDLVVNNTNFSDFWMLGENIAFIYPLLNGNSLVALYIHDAEKKAWKQNPEFHFNELVNSLEDGPDIRNASRLTSIIGMTDIRTFYRKALHNNIPFYRRHGCWTGRRK